MSSSRPRHYRPVRRTISSQPDTHKENDGDELPVDLAGKSRLGVSQLREAPSQQREKGDDPPFPIHSSLALRPIRV